MIIKAEDTSIVERRTLVNRSCRSVLALLKGFFMSLALNIGNPVGSTGLFPFLHVMAVGKAPDVVVLSTNYLGVLIIPPISTNTTVNAHIVNNDIAIVFSTIDFDCII